jgi:hypothetical protein
MGDTNIDIDEDTQKSIRARVLETEDANLGYDRPPSIIKDLKQVVEEEIPSLNDDEDD